MRIAEASRELGISTSTMKRLERKGIIRVQRDRNNQRRYSADDIAQIRRLYYPTALAPTEIARAFQLARAYDGLQTVLTAQPTDFDARPIQFAAPQEPSLGSIRGAARRISPHRVATAGQRKTPRP